RGDGSGTSQPGPSTPAPIAGGLMKADLDRLFEDLDRLEAPASWPEVTRRQPGPPIGEPERPKRFVTVVVALVIGAAGVSLFLRAFVFVPIRPVPPSIFTPGPTWASQSPSPPPPPGWVRHTGDAGVSIDTPEAWTFNSDPVPALVEPTM